jgi:hypothetical protein
VTRTSIDPNVTRQAYVALALRDATDTVHELAERVVFPQPPLKRLEREAYRMRLAGVIGVLESVRVWLASGSPQ